MKKLTLIALIICVLLGGKLVYFMFTPDPTYYQVDPAMQSRIAKSIEGKAPKYTIMKEAQITHIDGTPTKFYVVKMECCGVGGFVQGGNIYMGYVNEQSYKSPLSTTTEMLPIIEMPILVHELSHLVTLHGAVRNSCTEITSPLWQETRGYNTEHLYTQIKSLHEDNFIRLEI